MADYSAGAKILHQLVLGSPFMGEVMFDVEQSLFLKSSPEVATAKHVFVSGLARAGTTILMREIHLSEQFGSLTYADMPFVLSPNLWQKIRMRSPKQIEAKERAHGDGIVVNQDSPEALDEPFWRVFCGKEYIQSNRLQCHKPDEETLESFINFIRLVLRSSGSKRYLSKNNNNILRLESLSKRLSSSVFLVPIREPLQHAHSLLTQHTRFVDADEFTVKYMRWLGHHEFGATHRPFIFSDDEPQYSETSDLSYWVERWIDCYTYLSRFTQNENVYFVPYASLCEEPRFWPALTEVLGITATDPQFRKSQRNVEHSCADDLVERANDLYEELVSAAKTKLNVGAES